MDHDSRSLVVCIGSPLLDIIVEVDEIFLKKHNLEANSAKAIDTNFFKTILTMDHRYEIGGSVTNTARVLQAILKQKNAVTYLGAIGKDADGEIIKNTLYEEGVLCVFKKCEDAQTGRCAVLINGQNRSLCTDLGASKLYKLEDLRDIRVQHSLEHAKCLYISAFFLSVAPNCVMEMVKFKDKIIAFNIGAVFLCKKYPKEMLEVLKYVDIVFGNDHEAQALSEIMNGGGEHIRDVCYKISAFEKSKSQTRTVVITRGPETLIVASEGAVKEYEIRRMSIDEIKDTNGAGDAFAGGFLAKYIQGCSTEVALRSGIATAQEIIKNVGCCFDTEKMYRLCNSRCTE